MVPRFSLIFAFPRRPQAALDPSHHHPNSRGSRAQRSKTPSKSTGTITNLFASTSPPEGRQQRQGERLGETGSLMEGGQNVAGNTSHKTPCRPGNATHDDRASNPTVCQLSDPVPWQQNKATWRWTKDTKRAVTGDEAVDMLSLLLSSDRGNTSSASDGRSALASASGPPRFSTARRTPDHWHVDECCQVCTGPWPVAFRPST